MNAARGIHGTWWPVDLRHVFCDEGTLNERKDFAAVCRRVLVLNMCVKVGSRIRLIFASRTRQPINDVDGTTLGRGLGLWTERYQNGHNPE